MTASTPEHMTQVEMLTTTRSVRKRLDLTRPVPRDLIMRCLDVAVQAPSGSNLQGWQFLVVDDQEGKAALADFYRRSHAQYEPVTPRSTAGRSEATSSQLRGSVDYLAEHLHEVPTLLVPILRGRLPENASNHQAAGFYGSILPAVWSFMLVARTYGLGTSYTTMHLRHEQEVAERFGIPYERVTQIGLVAVGFYTGRTFSKAQRRPASELTHWNRW